MKNLVKDTFTAKKFLPVHLTNDGMELVEASLQKQKDDDVLFVEIGEGIEDTPPKTRALLQELLPGLLEEAIEEQCEYIQFCI